MDHVPGVIYLLHLDRPYKHARHYLGRASNLDARLAHHASGTGANLLRVAKEAGIGWTLARTWPGDRFRERQLKRQGGRSRLCPICKEAAAAAGKGRAENAELQVDAKAEFQAQPPFSAIRPNPERAELEAGA